MPTLVPAPPSLPTGGERTAPSSSPSWVPPPTALTLSYGGVQFGLTPSNNEASLAYKSDGQGGIHLNLENFSGSLRVYLASSPSPQEQPPLANAMPGAASILLSAPPKTTTTTVEARLGSEIPKVVVEEPNSPDVLRDETARSSTCTHVTPGQQKLSFQKTSKSTASTKKNLPSQPTPQKNKQQHQQQSQPPRKKCRIEEATTSTSSNTFLSQPSMEQDEAPSQSSQGNVGATGRSIPGYSQTMPTGAPSNSRDSSNNFSQAPSNAVSNTESVQDILNRVNSSSDSVATVRDDEEVDSQTNAREAIVQSDTTETKPVNNATKNPCFSSKTSSDTEENPPCSPVVPAYAAPCPRWGHTMTRLKDDRLLIYGGQSFDLQGRPTILSDVHVYHPSQRRWDKPIHCRGEARQWHSATFLPERQLLLAFGGETMLEEDFGTTSKGKPKKKKSKLITSDSLKVLDTEIMLWYPPAVSGDVPSARSGHTATLIPTTNEVVLFGGVKGSKWLNTVSVLDTVRWIWTTPKVHGSAPKPRSYHSATAVPASSGGGCRVVMFGGNNKTSCFNTIHVLELETATNKNETTSNQTLADSSAPRWKWSHPLPKGQAPFPRTGHSATLLADGKTIVVYGGWDPNEEGAEEGEENIFKSSFWLDTETWTWSKGPRAWSGGNGTEEDNSGDEMGSVGASMVEDGGPKRCGHTAEINAETGEVILFGGRIPGEMLAGDFQRLAEK